MSRIRPLSHEEVPAIVQSVYDEYLRLRGNVPNMFRTLAHVPELMLETNAYFKTVMRPGVISLRLKEMLAVRVSQLHLCDY
jgi:hypothetical protein